MGKAVIKTEMVFERVTERNVSLDILRILCMFMIVLGHAIHHGMVTEVLREGSLNYYIITTANSFLMVHVNCFVLISGYFLCKQEFRLKKVLALWIQTFFWSVTLYLISCAYGQTVFSVKELVKALLPFTQQRYWFVTTYLLMYFLVPLLNAAINTMNKKQHAAFLMTYFIVYTVLQNLVYWREFTTVSSRSPLFFAFLYLIAAYFRLYPAKKKNWLGWYIFFCVFVTIWKILISTVTTSVFGETFGVSAFSSYNSVTVVLAAVCLFKFFQEKQVAVVGEAKILSKISSVTFGVYLVHDNAECRAFLWRVLLSPARYVDNPALILILLGMAVIVFVCCGVLEYGRQMVFKRIKVNSVVSLTSEKIEKLVCWATKRMLDVE